MVKKEIPENVNIDISFAHIVSKKNFFWPKAFNKLKAFFQLLYGMRYFNFFTVRSYLYLLLIKQ